MSFIQAMVVTSVFHSDHQGLSQRLHSTLVAQCPSAGCCKPWLVTSRILDPAHHLPASTGHKSFLFAEISPSTLFCNKSPSNNRWMGLMVALSNFVLSSFFFISNFKLCMSSLSGHPGLYKYVWMYIFFSGLAGEEAFRWSSTHLAFP